MAVGACMVVLTRCPARRFHTDRGCSTEYVSTAAQSSRRDGTEADAGSIARRSSVKARISPDAARAWRPKK
jgi:hypothetical protein